MYRDTCLARQVNTFEESVKTLGFAGPHLTWTLGPRV